MITYENILSLIGEEQYLLSYKSKAVTNDTLPVIMGVFARDLMRENLDSRNFSVFGPDETTLHQLGKLFNIIEYTSTAEILQSHKAYVDMHGEYLPEIINWKWTITATQNIV